jgi:hypothetical protein
MNKEKELVDVLNKMISVCKKIKYEDLNFIIEEKQKDQLLELEIEYPKLGIRKSNYDDDQSSYSVSTLSIISTITDVLIDKRLSFIIDDDGYISGVDFYEK